MFTNSGFSKRLRVCIVAIALAGFGPVSMVRAATPALAHGSAPKCQCVDYIKHSYGISGSTGNAKDMGAKLVGTHGFQKLSKPVVGAIVVFQPSFGRVNPTYGHVGRILSVSDLGSEWQLKVRSANYGGSQSRLDCKNMNDVLFRSYAKSSGSIAYYKR